MRLQTAPLRVFPTPKHVLNLSSHVQGFLSCRAHPLQEWLQLLGVMSSMSTLILGSRLRMRALQLWLSVAGTGLLNSTEASWDNSCLKNLQWWSVESHLVMGRPLNLSLPELTLHRRFRYRLGGFSRRQPSLRLVVSFLLHIFNQSIGSFLQSSMWFWVFFHCLAAAPLPCTRTTPPHCPISARLAALVRLLSTR